MFEYLKRLMFGQSQPTPTASQPTPTADDIARLRPYEGVKFNDREDILNYFYVKDGVHIYHDVARNKARPLSSVAGEDVDRMLAHIESGRWFRCDDQGSPLGKPLSAWRVQLRELEQKALAAAEEVADLRHKYGPRSLGRDDVMIARNDKVVIAALV